MKATVCFIFTSVNFAEVERLGARRPDAEERSGQRAWLQLGAEVVAEDLREIADVESWGEAARWTADRSSG